MLHGIRLSHMYMFCDLRPSYIQQPQALCRHRYKHALHEFFWVAPFLDSWAASPALSMPQVPRWNAPLQDTSPLVHFSALRGTTVQSTPAYRSTTILIAATRISAAMRTMTGPRISAVTYVEAEVWKPNARSGENVTYRSTPSTPHASFPPDLSTLPANPQ